MMTLHQSEIDSIHLSAKLGTLEQECRDNPRTLGNMVAVVTQLLEQASLDDARIDDLEREVERLESRRDTLADDLREWKQKAGDVMAKVKELTALMEGAAGPEAEISARCKGCEKPITWAVTDEGKRIPLDLRPPVYANTGRTDHSGAPIVERRKGAAVSHFATCSKANEFSQSKKAEKS